MIFEYMLIRESGKTITPYWVEDGGVFVDPDNHTMLGWSPDFGKRVYYVPDSVLTMDRAGAVARALDIHTRYPFLTDATPPAPMTDEQVSAMVNNWCDAHGE